MKFSELNKLVHVNSPTYIDLAGIQSMFDRWTQTYGLDLNPDFQRGHVWTEEQQIKFVEFIARGGKFPTIMFNSPTFGGYQFSKNADLTEDIVLVDGKQRLTAIMKFIHGELKIFGGFSIDDFEDKTYFLRSTDLLYVVNRINTRKELIKWYIEINEGQVAHTPEELARVKSLIQE